MTGFEIASGYLGREGVRLTEHGAGYDGAYQRLKERGDGASWNDDGLFGAFTAAYSECVRVSLAALTGLAGEITGTGDGLARVARNTREAEAANAEITGGPTWV
jgi:hypothetical protein